VPPLCVKKLTNIALTCVQNKTVPKCAKNHANWFRHFDVSSKNVVALGFWATLQMTLYLSHRESHSTCLQSVSYTADPNNLVASMSANLNSKLSVQWLMLAVQHQTSTETG